MMFRIVMIPLLLLVMAAQSSAAEAPPGELILQVQRNASPADEQVELTMTLFENGGSISQRNAVFLQRQTEPGSDQDMRLIRFSSPPEMDGSAVLTIENKARPDDQWLYLPAYHTSRRIPSSNRSDRYMGTDFYYEDVSDDKIDQFHFEYSREEDTDGRRYRVIEQIPEDSTVKRESAYGRKMLWVDPERLLVARIDFFDKAGTLIKRLLSGNPVRIEGRWRWNKVEMTDLRTAHRTLIEYRNRKMNKGIPIQTFSVRQLEKGR